MPCVTDCPHARARSCRAPAICRVSTIPFSTARCCGASCSRSRLSPTAHSKANPMVNVLVLYYSSYGHLEAMARAQSEGAAKVPGATVTVKRVPELVPPEVCKASGFKLDQPAPIADPNELDRYDAILFGTPTRFGNMAAQMRNFLDQTGP